MTFEEYMEKNIPGYKDLVPEDMIVEIKKDFEMKVGFDREANGYLKNTPSAGVDYSNKYEKAMGNSQRYAMILEGDIEKVKQALGLVDSEEKNTVSHK